MGKGNSTGTGKDDSRQLRVFQVLYELAVSMTAESSLDQNLQLVVNRSRELLDTDTAYIALCDETRGDVYMHSFSGIQSEEFKKLRIPMGVGLGGKVAETGQSFIIQDYFDEKTFTSKYHEIVAKEGLISGMAAPIQMGKKNLGVFYIFNRRKSEFTKSDLDTLFLIGNLTAVQISHKNVEAALKIAHDELEQRVDERTQALTQSNVLLKQEITERKKAERERQSTERRSMALLDFAPYPVVLYTLEGKVSYLNPAFTEVFGWSFDELAGKNIPFVPENHDEDISEGLKKLFEEKVILRYETKRLTKEGRVLDIIMRAALIPERENRPARELVIFRDITLEKRSVKQNEVMLRISRALPEYPELEELLDYISNEIKSVLDTEGGVVILLDEEKQELFFPGAAYDDRVTQKRIKEARFDVSEMDQIVAEKVIKTGQPLFINDTSKIRPYPLRDKKLGYETRNFLEVALKSNERIIGVLCAINKKKGGFEESDVELLAMMAGTVALSIENARFSEELKKAYREVSSMNRAKDKMFHHLSHELKTPVSVLYPSFDILSKKLAKVAEPGWETTIERAKRNLDRIMDIQYRVEDIIKMKSYKSHKMLSVLLDECSDELEALVAREVGEGTVIERLRHVIDDTFGPKKAIPEKIDLCDFVESRLVEIRPLFSHRMVDVQTRLNPSPAIFLPVEPLKKTFDGLVRNAIENTPDQGKIEIIVGKKGDGSELQVRDYGVGIARNDQQRIFEGFFHTQDTLAYSSKRPFDFNAGGKGIDLLRMKIFSERYHFDLQVKSSRCKHLRKKHAECPGVISECPHCKKNQGCHKRVRTTFSVLFPPAP